jgi:hypothetical protein
MLLAAQFHTYAGDSGEQEVTEETERKTCIESSVISVPSCSMHFFVLWPKGSLKFFVSFVPLVVSFGTLRLRAFA